jgi:DNA (cytosine-5)-methyltransferase 1
MNYYNEIDKYVAQWIRNLIAAGHIAPGDVDERSISDVRPSDLVGYTQCHFFAGIGGWSLALRLAGWPDDRPVWTGSCPCQPFSVAGAGHGVADERHLWPHWFHLVRALRPPVIFGEQVDAAIAHGWLDLVQDDLEGEGYAFGAVGVPAAGVGAPHIRQRLWFVADDQRFGREVAIQHTRDGRSATGEREADVCGIGGTPSWLAHNNNPRLEGREPVRQRGVELAAREDGVAVELGLSYSTGPQSGDRTTSTHGHRDSTESTGFWTPCDWLPCRDGKWRPVEPGTFPLAHGVSNRVGRLRAYGNAIVPQVAEQVIRAYMECRP